MRVQNNTTSKETATEQQETTTSTNDNGSLQYQQSRTRNTVGGENKNQKIE